MGYWWLILSVVLISCSVTEPLDGPFSIDTDSLDISSEPVDTTKVDPQDQDSLSYPTQVLPSVEFHFDTPLVESSSFAPDTLLIGPFTDNDVYTNSERWSWPFIQGRMLHSTGMNYVVEMGIDCQALPELNVTDFYMLHVADSVNIQDWMRYRNYDVHSISKPYLDAPVDTIRALSGIVDLINPELKYRLISEHYPEPRSRYIYELNYSLQYQDLVFENGMGIESVMTEQHFCFPGDGFGLSPQG